MGGFGKFTLRVTFASPRLAVRKKSCVTKKRRLRPAKEIKEAYAALEAVLVPLGVQGDDGLVQDRLGASLTPIRELVLEAVGADGLAVPLPEGLPGQALLAAGADEVVLVPVLVHRLDHFLRGETL